MPFSLSPGFSVLTSGGVQKDQKVIKTTLEVDSTCWASCCVIKAGLFVSSFLHCCFFPPSSHLLRCLLSSSPLFSHFLSSLLPFSASFHLVSFPLFSSPPVLCFSFISLLFLSHPLAFILPIFQNYFLSKNSGWKQSEEAQQLLVFPLNLVNRMIDIRWRVFSKGHLASKTHFELAQWRKNRWDCLISSH